MPDYLMPLFWVLAGFALLIAGGELLVRGAARLAAIAGISPLVVGLTVVALGTSAPEMAVTLQAGLRGETDMAVGNVVGSNICNVLLILGLSAAAAPLVVSARLVQWDVPLMILASLLVGALALHGGIAQWQGALLVAGLGAYVAWAVVQSRREGLAVREEYEIEFGVKTRPRNAVAQVALIVAGLGLLAIGSDRLVDGAAAIARLLGVGELLIGLTVLAVGTSLPELAASVIAAVRGERDIAVGNVVGSNLFNILGVLGVAAVLAPAGLPIPQAALHFDIPVMIAVAVACLPIFFTGHRIARWEGGLLLAYYFAYAGYLILDVCSERLTKTFGQVMLWFVIPLTAITLAIGAARSWRKRHTK